MGQSQSFHDDHISDDLIGNDDGNIDTIDTGFLVEHPLEKSGRRLLSKSDVFTSYQRQAKVENDAPRHTCDAAKDDVEKRSSMRPSRHRRDDERIQNRSEILSNAATEATRKMSNVDLSSPKRKFRERAQAKRMHQQQTPGNEDTRKVIEYDQHTRAISPELFNGKLHGRRVLLTGSGRKVKATCLSPTIACLSGSYGMVDASRSSVQNDTPYSKVLELSFHSLTLGKYEHQWRLAKRRDQSSPTAQHVLNTMDVNNTQSRKIMYSTNGESFLGLALSGSLGLASLGVSSPSNYEKDYLILRDSSTDVPLAVCALKSPHEEPVVRIYATKPCIGTQISAGSSSDIGIVGPSVDLFAFAEFRTLGSFPYPMRYALYFSSGEEGKYESDPKYKGSHPVPGLPNVTFVGRPGRDPIYRGCCLLTTEESKEYINQSNCQISISKGIDPALFVCIAAIIDEVAMWRQPSKDNISRRRYV